MVYMGIDPGLDGAIAIIFPASKDFPFPPKNDFPGVVMLYDTPTISTGKKRDYDIQAMSELIPSEVCTIAIEAVHSMPKQGVVSSFRFGYGYGLWSGIVVAHGQSLERITPQRWKKAMMDGMPKEKGASILRAKELFPEADIKLKKHHNRADALLIATYVYRLGQGSR